jgi:autotransporter passenger strand-loop-strand repeat protein
VSNAAIEVSKNVGSFTGGISNSGKLTALGEGIFVSSVAVFGNSSSGGGITNSGTISAGHSGIRVGLVFTSFSGGISNASSGKIVSTSGIGIFVGTSIGVFGNSSAGGGITNSGTISAHQSGILLQNFAIFAGGITNSGVISAHGTGIKITGVSTLFGGVSNSGKITATTGDGIDVVSVAVFGNGSAGGGIVNSGTISAGQSAIAVVTVGTFAGGISNSGKIAAAVRSIWVTDVGVFGNSNGAGGITNTGTMQGDVFLKTVETFFGSIVNGSAGKIIGGGIDFNDGTLFGAGSVARGITNASTISGGGGISVNAATFLGDISNSGKIVGTNGIGLSSVAIFGGSGSGGAIVNSGSISATHDGLRLILGFGTFAGGVTNAGVISAGATGVDISQIGMLSGGIVNSGTIAGKLGIGVFTTTVAGGIVDSGSIKATEAGISIDGLSEVLASKTAIDIAGPTFTGGIFNAGVVSGSAGIEIKSARAVSIFDGGTIIGTGGTAIEFAGSGNTLTLGAGYFISGIVDPQSGNNTFQLGGFGSDTFDLSSIGAAAQYQGFTIFNVVGGTWTVSSASTAHWTIKAGTLEITSGGSLTSTTVSSGGVLAIDSGATVSGVTIKTGATLELFGGIPLPSGVTIPAGATLGVGGGVYSGLIVSSGHTLKVLSGGTDLDATVRSGGALIVGSDGTDSGATILKGGVEKVTSGGASIDVALKSGGTEIVSAGGVASDTNVSSGGALVVSSGGTADPSTIFSGGSETVSAGGTDLGAQVAGGRLFVLSGGTAVGGAISSGGTEIVSGHGFDASATVFGGGKLFVRSGGSAVDITSASGGTAINSVGANLDAVVSATDSGTLVNSGAVNVRNGGTLTVGAATLNNAGSINLLGTFSATELLIEQNVTLSGGGTVSMSGNQSLITGGSGFTLTNVNNKIIGVGEIGNSHFAINNQSSGVINGNGTVFHMELAANVTNAGLIEGTTSQGLLIDSATLTNSGTVAALGTSASVMIINETVINATTKALILASGNGAQVDLELETISGGTLKTSAGGTIAARFGTLSGVTIAPSSLIEVTNGSLSGGTIGAGAVVETSGGAVFVAGTVSNGGTLFANSAGDEVSIMLGAVVNGGVALINNGIVKIAGSSGESVKFLPLGGGGLEIANQPGQTSAFSGKVSGFGGGDHTNNVQFINLPSVTFNPNVSKSYVPANGSNTSGTLFVSSGGLVAAINFIGAYSAGNFNLGDGSFLSLTGTVIKDPVVPNGGSVNSDMVKSSMPHSGIDLPDIAFGAQTTLAYAQNGAGEGGTLTVTDGRHAAAFALLGNYMAGSFVAVTDGHGGTLITEANPQQQQPLLTHPPHG